MSNQQEQINPGKSLAFELLQVEQGEFQKSMVNVPVEEIRKFIPRKPTNTLYRTDSKPLRVD